MLFGHIFIFIKNIQYTLYTPVSSTVEQTNKQRWLFKEYKNEDKRTQTLFFYHNIR